METKFLGDFGHDSIRHHPWTEAVRDSRGRYYDFKKQPELIRTVLEDFTQWEQFDGVQRFYEMLEWLNGPDSNLESNDCTMRGPHPNTIKAVNRPITCGGRLMFFFRELSFNLSMEKISWLREATQYILERLPGNELTYAQLTLFDTLYTELEGSDVEKIGKEIVIEFWAWGHTGAQAMDNFKIVVANLFYAFQQISANIHESLDEPKASVSV